MAIVVIIIIKTKNRYHRLYKRSNNVLIYSKFSHYRKLVKTTLINDKNNWLNSIDKELKLFPQHFWKYVQSFRKDVNNHVVLKKDNKTISETADIVEIFASHFRNQNNSQLPYRISDEIDSGVSINPYKIHTQEVFKTIESLKPSRTAGSDGIPNFIIKGCSEIFSPILAHIFNLSLRDSKFPTIWKSIVVVPVPKKCNKNNVTNY
ncbi:hypothetical protein C0J52_02943 [Blattella germanica]|nr:hypothetical protein C0J52_02943 [Blattella germanica]